jgi:UDP-N-acetylenolpyruvoylglucosamine reductase
MGEIKMTDLQRLFAIQDANKLLSDKQQESVKCFGSAFNNPVWDELNHAGKHLAHEAAALLSE